MLTNNNSLEKLWLNIEKSERWDVNIFLEFCESLKLAPVTLKLLENLKSWLIMCYPYVNTNKHAFICMVFSYLMQIPDDFEIDICLKILNIIKGNVYHNVLTHFFNDIPIIFKKHKNYEIFLNEII